MCVELEGITEIKFNGDKLSIRPMHEMDKNDEFWKSVMFAVLDGDSECTAEQMVSVSPAGSLLLFAALAESLNSLPKLPLMNVSKVQQAAIEILCENVKGNEDV